MFQIEAPVFGASHPRFGILLAWANSEIAGRYAPAGRQTFEPKTVSETSAAE